MQRLAFGFVNLVIILFLLATGVHAAPEAAAAGRVGPYEGAFQGVAYGDEGSRAPLELEQAALVLRVEQGVESPSLKPPQGYALDVHAAAAARPSAAIVAQSRDRGTRHGTDRF